MHPPSAWDARMTTEARVSQSLVLGSSWNTKAPSGWGDDTWPERSQVTWAHPVHDGKHIGPRHQEARPQVSPLEAAWALSAPVGRRDPEGHAGF